jgi:diamine N-acetyltransferase
MATVELRDIVTEDDVEAVMGLRRGPGQDRYLGSMISHFEDAIADARACPRMWAVHDGASGNLVGFVMISDGIPAETLAADDDIVGPYFLWRLLIDHRHQGHGFGAATVAAVVDYLRTRPGAGVLLTSCGQGDGSPLDFYLRCGFTRIGEKWGEALLSLDLGAMVGDAASDQAPVSIGGPV